jgi:hypothetical protein
METIIYFRKGISKYEREMKFLFFQENICHTFRFHTQKNISFIEQFSQIAAKTRSTNQSQGSNSFLKNILLINCFRLFIIKKQS